MNTPSTPREPTMEEILASIRRIIAEEGQAAPAKPVVASLPEPPAELLRETHAPAKILPAGPIAVNARAEDILELTDLIDDEQPARAAAVPPPAAVGTPLRPLPEPEPAPSTPAPSAFVPPAPAPPAPATALFGDVLPPPTVVSPPPVRSPTAVLVRPLPVFDPAPSPSVAQPLASAPAPAPAPAPAAAPAPAPQPPAQQMVLAGPAAEVESPLLTMVAEEMVSTSMRQVADAIRAEKPVPASPTSTPLEGLVLEALRPALKSWIDQNLAPMVERLMKDEMRRLARRIEDE